LAGFYATSKHLDLTQTGNRVEPNGWEVGKLTGDAATPFRRRGVPWEGAAELTRVIGVYLDLLASDDVDLLLVKRLPIGVAQFDGVIARA
jgi:hypothetical protein